MYYLNVSYAALSLLCSQIQKQDQCEIAHTKLGILNFLFVSPFLVRSLDVPQKDRKMYGQKNYHHKYLAKFHHDFISFPHFIM